MEIPILKDIRDANKATAEEVKKILKEKNIFMIDMMSSPGSGKTTLNDKIIENLKTTYNIGVIEGDIKTTKDSEKLAKHNIQIMQIETDRFGGDCHLESSWIKSCLDYFNLDELDFIIVENVGNLVCPAEFEIGDDERMVVLSITEGEDKPLKYPLAFNTSHSVILSKMDLLPHLDIKIDEIKENVKKVNPSLNIFELSAKTGEGLDELLAYIEDKIKAKKG